MSFLNGDLADESDDIIDDTMLYFMFVKLAARARHIGGDLAWEQALEEATAQYREPYPGARDRVIQVLRIMLTAWIASSLKTQAEDMIAALKADTEKEDEA
jgi:hypothetical protein